LQLAGATTIGTTGITNIAGGTTIGADGSIKIVGGQIISPNGGIQGVTAPDFNTQGNVEIGGNTTIGGAITIAGVITNNGGINIIDSNGNGSTFFTPNGNIGMGYNLLNVVQASVNHPWVWNGLSGFPMPVEVLTPFVTIGSSNKAVIFADGDAYFGGTMGVVGNLVAAGSVYAFNLDGGLINMSTGASSTYGGPPNFPGGYVGIGSNTIVLKTNGDSYFAGTVQENGLDVHGPTIIIDQPTTPADNAACTTGTIWWDVNYLYLCTSSGNVKRAALSTY
jgi:hypothetical protein